MALIILLVVIAVNKASATDYSVSSTVSGDFNSSTYGYKGTAATETKLSADTAYQSGNDVYGPNNPIAYTSLMASDNDQRGSLSGPAFIKHLKITVVITDASGNTISGLQAGNLGMLLSPNDAGSDWVNEFLDLFNFLTSLKGLPAVPNLKNGVLASNTGSDSGSAWAEWDNTYLDNIDDKAIDFRYQPNFPGPGVYTISISTHSELWWHFGGGSSIDIANVDSSYSFHYIYENDAGIAGDTGPDFSTSRGISLGSYTGLLYGADTLDMYKFDSTAGQTYYFTVVPPIYTMGSSALSDVGVSIYDPAWNLVAGSNLGPGQTNGGSFTASSTGSYFMKAYLNNGGGIYWFAISNQPNTLSSPDLSLSGSPNPAVFDPSSLATTSTVTAGSINSFTGTISLSFTVSPSTGANCALSQTSISLANNSGSVSLLCGESTLQTYTITLTGVAGRLTHTITIPFINQGGGGGCAGSSNTCPKHT